MGSLCPTFVSARVVSLAVKLAFAFTLFNGFPFRLSQPLGASVTFYEATAPVKLPTRHGPLAYPGLEPKTEKSGISTLAPSRLASGLQSLPPILHIPAPGPIPRCSKAPRGLFVLSRDTRIFTGLAISPSPSLRQRPSRYAFPAGRNLPDKGFRYLRTVIVTAAVHRGFSSELPPRLASRLHPSPYPSGTGQASAPIRRVSP